MTVYKKISPEFKKVARASLAKAIQAWMDQECENVATWRSQIGYVGDETERHMADAALAVLYGLTEAQGYAVKEGYLNEP